MEAAGAKLYEYGLEGTVRIDLHAHGAVAATQAQLQTIKECATRRSAKLGKPRTWHSHRCAPNIGWFSYVEKYGNKRVHVSNELRRLSNQVREKQRADGTLQSVMQASVDELVGHMAAKGGRKSSKSVRSGSLQEAAILPAENDADAQQPPFGGSPGFKRATGQSPTAKISSILDKIEGETSCVLPKPIQTTPDAQVALTGAVEVTDQPSIRQGGREMKKSIQPQPRDIINALTTTGCYLWPGAVNANGYPLFHDPTTGKTTRVNRFILENSAGPPPTDKHHAAHSCGNKLCVNPGHLEWKTASENWRDRLSHHSNGKVLSPIIVLAIYRTNGMIPDQVMAEKLNTVSVQMINRIRNDQSWKNLTSLTADEQRSILEDYKSSHEMTTNDIWAFNTLELLAAEPVLGPTLLQRKAAMWHPTFKLLDKLQTATNDGDIDSMTVALDELSEIYSNSAAA